MPGFNSETGSESIMFADNVSFDGTQRAGAVNADGQLLIGSTTAPHIRVGSLTSIDGSVVFTPGHGTIDLSAFGVNVNQDQIYYVGKHGNDANSGMNIENAFLTFGAGITAATALIPSATNRFAIVCSDDGIYTEDITDVSFVDIFAPSATLSGTLIVDDNCNIKFFAQNAATGTTAITKPAGSTYSNVEIEVITCAGTANGCTCSTGFLNLTWKQLYVVDGYGIGDISVGLGHIHVKGGDIYISGTGIGVIRANTGSTVGRIDHILDLGAGTGAAIIVYDGTVNINVSMIHVSNAYNVQGSAGINPVLNLVCNEIIGTQLCSGGGQANVWTPPSYPLNQGGMTDGQLAIGSSVSPNIRLGSLSSTDSTVTITPGHGTIDLSASPMALTFDEDSGTASPSSGALNIEGGTSSGGVAANINTIGSGSTVSVCLNNSISLPNTDTTGALGLYSLGSAPFMHNYGASNSTFLGTNAGNLTNNSNNNVGIGAYSLNGIATGNSNVAIGSNALTVNDGQDNIAIGHEALYNSTLGSFSTVVGSEAAKNCAATLFEITAVGYRALNYAVAGGCTAVGCNALTGSASTTNASINNSAFGYRSLIDIYSGSNNSAFGMESLGANQTGNNLTAVGALALVQLVSGSDSIAIGNQAGYYYTTSESSNIIIGNKGTIGDNNKIRIGTQGSGAGQQNACYIAGISGVTVPTPQMVAINPSTGQLGSIPISIPLHAKLSLNSTQILSLNSSPITIVSAVGANTIINVVNVSARFVYGGNTPFLTGGTVGLYYTSSSGIQATMGFFSTVMLGSVDGYASAPANLLVDEPIGGIDNQDIVIASSADFTGNITADNSLIVDVVYWVSTLT